MNIKLLVLLGAMTLGGCTLIANPVNDTEVQGVVTALGTAQGLAIGYGALAACPQPAGIACHDKALLKQAVAYAHLAEPKVEALVAWHQANPTGSAVTFGQLLNAAEAAIGTLQQYENLNHIGASTNG